MEQISFVSHKQNIPQSLKNQLTKNRKIGVDKSGFLL